MTDAIADLAFQADDPNNREHTSTNLGTWSSVSSVDAFLSRFNHNNAYKDKNTKLSVGNYVTIQDGSYNVEWMIAGFDMESKQYAADGTLYDNGYGICMIPRIYVTGEQWNNSYTVTGAYMSSTMHTTHLPKIATRLQNVLGSHIVNRNVLLSSSVDTSNYYSNGYTWTTAYSTLMSVGQMTGTFGSNKNKYDDGEANYKLPIFDFAEYKTGYNFWLRNLNDFNGHDSIAYFVTENGNISLNAVNNYGGVRQLIYIR